MSHAALDLITLREAAEILGISYTRAYQLAVAEGRFITFRFGQNYLAERSAVVDFGKIKRPRGRPADQRKTKAK